MLKFEEVYGLAKNGKIEEIKLDNLLRVKPELLESNRIKINELVEVNYPELSIAEKFRKKVQMSEFVSSLTQMLANKKEDIYFDILNFELYTIQDFAHGMKVTGPDGQSMIDWNLMKEEAEIQQESSGRTK